MGWSLSTSHIAVSGAGAAHPIKGGQRLAFGALCPKKGKGAGLVLPYCDTGAMNEHLKEIAQAVDPGAYAVLILDQAAWHTTPKLKVPRNITLNGKRFSAKMKLAAVQRLLRGESLEALSRELNAPAHRLSDWRPRADRGRERAKGA